MNKQFIIYPANTDSFSWTVAPKCSPSIVSTRSWDERIRESWVRPTMCFIIQTTERYSIKLGIRLSILRFGVFTVANVRVTVFWVVQGWSCDPSIDILALKLETLCFSGTLASVDDSTRHQNPEYDGGYDDNHPQRRKFSDLTKW